MAQYEITNEQIARIDFSVSGVDRILQNCKNLLCTRMGEVPYDRMRGFNWALFDLTARELDEELIPELDRVMEWEPEAEVVDGYMTMTEENEWVIHCIVEVADEDEGE